MQTTAFTSGARFGVARRVGAARTPSVRRAAPVVRAAAQTEEMVDELGYKLMRKGVKVAAADTILTPRFYTTDFDEMEEMFDAKKHNLNMEGVEQLLASLEEFRKDYNQKHFVRNETFQVAAEKLKGPIRKIFVEFLERGCTAEFSGFLLYKELGRRLAKSNPPLAEIFTLLSRDEARHAGFINKGLSDFNLALDLGFLTKNRQYTYFKPKFIIYATYLSEKIGYWRYISIYRHLQRNPDNQLYPLFEYFENWCQDESRHGDFLAASLKVRPELLHGWEADMWSRFFCLSVYVTMYLNDHQRRDFYQTLGMNVDVFDRHVITETNKSTERIFPVVPDHDHPDFFPRLHRIYEINESLIAIDKLSYPSFVKNLMKLPGYERLTAELVQLFFMPIKKCGSLDMEPELEKSYIY